MSNTFASINCDDDQLSDLRDLKALAENTEDLILTAVVGELSFGELAVPAYRTGDVARYRQLALHHLEIAIMFANKGISRRQL